MHISKTKGDRYPNLFLFYGTIYLLFFLFKKKNYPYIESFNQAP
jgi:hypothetical protein